MDPVIDVRKQVGMYLDIPIESCKRLEGWVFKNYTGVCLIIQYLYEVFHGALRGVQMSQTGFISEVFNVD